MEGGKSGTDEMVAKEGSGGGLGGGPTEGDRKCGYIETNLKKVGKGRRREIMAIKK